IQGLSLRACARRAGVSHAAPKHHFNDVANLLAEVAARGFTRLSRALRKAREEVGDDPEGRFVATARTYVTFARDYPAYFRLMFRSDALNLENEALTAAAAETFTEMTNTITVQRHQPDVTPENLVERIREEGLSVDVLIGWSHIHGYAQLLLEGQLDVFAAGEDPDVFLERTLTQTGRRISQVLQKGES
ncbi:MAG: TetR/AcrR family transcriptional regulator, partial [Pseudomonadales bacterium]